MSTAKVNYLRGNIHFYALQQNRNLGVFRLFVPIQPHKFRGHHIPTVFFQDTHRMVSLNRGMRKGKEEKALA